MTQLFPFTPSTRSAPSFTATLDGQQYACTVTWNLQGQRYYLNVSTLQGARVLSIAVVETPPGLALEAATYTGTTGVATFTTITPHGVPLGRVVRRTVTRCVPAGYNGTFLMLAVGPNTLTCMLPANPGGPATTAGALSALANLVQGYFASTLVYRANRFEVDP